MLNMKLKMLIFIAKHIFFPGIGSHLVSIFFIALLQQNLFF